MPRPMPPQPCHDVFTAAEARRAAYPLRSGLYKLHEVQSALKRMQATMCAVGDHFRRPGEVLPGALLGCCTTDDIEFWVKGLPAQVADLIGYDLLPAIAALRGDGIAETDVRWELESARANARRLLQDCEKQHKRLQTGIEREYRSMKKGYSDVYALLVDADGIARRALELIDWCEARARLAETHPGAELWGWTMEGTD